MLGMFPQFNAFLDATGMKRNKTPGMQQVMPQAPTMAQPMMGGQPPMPGQRRQRIFNQQQQDANRGMVGGGMNRRRF